MQKVRKNRKNNTYKHSRRSPIQTLIVCRRAVVAIVEVLGVVVVVDVVVVDFEVVSSGVAASRIRVAKTIVEGAEEEAVTVVT